VYKQFRLFLTLGCLFFSLIQPVRSQDSETMTAAARAYVIAEIRSAVDVYFAHWCAVDRSRVSAAFKAYVGEAYASDDRRAFDFATMRYFAALKNGHTSFSDAWLIRNYDQRLGFYARPIDGAWTVVTSDLSDLRPGDIIDRIDSTKIDAFAAARMQYLAASSHREQMLDLFKHGYLFPPTFDVLVSNGKVVHIARTQPATQTFKSTESRWLSPGVGYIAVHSFLRPEFESAAQAAVKSFAKASAIIVDVRGNAGGVTPDGLIASLMDKPISTFSESSPIVVSYYKADAAFISDARDPALDLAPPLATGTLSWDSPAYSPSSSAYGGRLAVLVDGSCASACEDFVVPFKLSKRAIIVGEETYGSTGQPFFDNLPDGMWFRVSAKRAIFPDGSTFEGVGIAPDIMVKVTAPDLRAGKDPVLVRALQVVSSHA
jgi:carboxyl-terminal processing protease